MTAEKKKKRDERVREMLHTDAYIYGSQYCSVVRVLTPVTSLLSYLPSQICELAAMDFDTVSLRGPPALSNTRLRKGVPPPKRPLSTVAGATAAAAAAAADEGDDEANRLPFESYLGLTLEEVEAVEKRVSQANEVAAAAAAEATAATKAAADAVEAETKAEAEKVAAAAAAAAAASATAAPGTAPAASETGAARAAGAVSSDPTATTTASGAVVAIAPASTTTAAPAAPQSSQVATLQAAAQAASVKAQRAQARLASLPPPVTPAEDASCCFCGLTQTFSTQPWVRVPDLLLKPISDEVLFAVVIYIRSVT